MPTSRTAVIIPLILLLAMWFFSGAVVANPSPTDGDLTSASGSPLSEIVLQTTVEQTNHSHHKKNLEQMSYGKVVYEKQFHFRIEQRYTSPFAYHHPMFPVGTTNKELNEQIPERVLSDNTTINSVNLTASNVSSSGEQSLGELFGNSISDNELKTYADSPSDYDIVENGGDCYLIWDNIPNRWDNSILSAKDYIEVEPTVKITAESVNQ